MSDFLEKTEQYTVDIINGRNKTIWDRVYRVFLFVLSRLYRNIVQLRLSLYSSSVLKQQDPGCIVISVGNLTTGGTGKTPVVELLSRTLAERGRHVAILSRGYRSKEKRTFWSKLKGMFLGGNDSIPPRVVSDGKKVMLDSEEAGDEPFMLASNLLATDKHSGVSVVVDKDRVKGGSYAIQHMQADTLILDDGFQYLRLRPRLNILLVDSTNPFHNHEMLPCGLLREPIKNIRRANFVFMTKSNGKYYLRHLRSFILRHNPAAAVIECNHVPCYLQNVTTRERLELQELKGKKIAALSAIAVPTSFLNYLTQLGGEIVYSKHFVDHHRYKKPEIEEFFRKANKHGAEIIVTTEKDAVRLPSLPEGNLPVYFLRIAIKILKGHEEFEKCITQICLE
ncbi:MAG: tetraacyldisaccharide 4'-kinase [Victivallales bacterium]|nr:tetraacyldisaccharide 4'-kinase [Victivallales bacterium]